jgi:glycosyltransferase involved in cell wall biosynthesis
MGGVARVATDTAVRLASGGHDVVVLAPEHETRPRLERDDGLALHRVLPRGRLPQTLTDPPLTRRAARALADRRFDVMVAHNSTTGFGLLRARVDAPLVQVFHADAVAESAYWRSVSRVGPTWLARLALEQPLRYFARSSLRGAASVVVLSEYSRRLLAALDPGIASAAITVLGAVDTDRFVPDCRDDARAELGIPPDSRVVLTVRRLVPRMGVSELLAATALLKDLEDLHLIVAGSGELEGELHKRCRELGIVSHVRILGRVSDDDLRLWYRAADLFVLPSQAHEGFGLVTAEALASGTPVVGTPVGATPDLLTPLEPRLVANGTDANALAEVIRAGLELANPALRSRCRTYAEERLSWRAAMPKWEAVLRAATSGDRPFTS